MERASMPLAEMSSAAASRKCSRLAWRGSRRGRACCSAIPVDPSVNWRSLAYISAMPNPQRDKMRMTDAELTEFLQAQRRLQFASHNADRSIHPLPVHYSFLHDDVS